MAYSGTGAPPGAITYVLPGDSASTIQSKLNSVQPGNTLVFTSGTYDFGGTTITGKSGVTLWADGQVVIDNAPAAGTSGAFDFSGQSNWTIGGDAPGQGFVFQGSLINATNAINWAIGNSQFNNEASNGFDGSAIRMNGASFGTIINNDFTGVGGNVLGQYDLNNVTIDGNHFTNCFQPISIQEPTTDDASLGNNIVIQRNVFIGTQRVAVEIGPASSGSEHFSGLVISNNYFDNFNNTAGEGTLLAISAVGQSSQNTTITNNFINRGSSDGGDIGVAIEMTGTGTVSGNTIANFSYAALTYQSGWNVSGNTVYNDGSSPYFGFANNGSGTGTFGPATELSGLPAPPAIPTRLAWGGSPSSSTVLTVTEKLASDTGTSSTDKITSNPAITGLTDANATVHFIVDGSAVATTATANTSGAWSFTPNGLADGQHMIVASETDASGQTGTASLTFTLDTLAPDTSVVTEPPSLTTETSASFSWSGTDNAGGSGIDHYLYQVDGGNWTSTNSTAQSFSSLSNGSHTFHVEAVDGAGNVDATPASYGWTVDTVAPAPPVLTSEVLNSNGTLALSGTADAGSTVTVLDGTTQASYGPKATSAPAGAIILHPGDDVSALVDAAPAGATFYFEPGVYRGVSLSPADGQTFIGAEGAILNGSAVLTDWTQSGNLWVIGGQTQSGPVFPWAGFEPGTQRPGYPETVFLDNTPLKPVDDLSKVVPGTFYFDYAADKIYIADNPAGHTVEAGKLTDAFHGSATNVTVQNLVIEKYDPQIQDGAIHGDQSWTIRDNEVRLNYAVGITAHDGSQIIGNYVHDNGQMGLGGHGDNIVVQGNELATNGFWSGVSPYWEAGGFKFVDTDNLVVRGNYSHDNNGSGMWTDFSNIHTLYEDNVVVHNTINGIQHEISYDAIIRNNTLVGNGYGDTRGWGWGAEIDIQDSQNVQIYGNQLDMTGGNNGIILIQQDRGSGTYGTYATTGNQIHDNIIVDRDDPQIGIASGNSHGAIGGFADYNMSGMLNGGNTWSNNQYFMSDGLGRFQWGYYETFAQFQAAAGETGSLSQSYPDTSDWLTQGFVVSGQALVFSPNAKVVITDPSAFHDTISSFLPGDTIDFTTIGYKSSLEAIWHADVNGGTLQVVDTANSSTVANLSFAGSFSGEVFTLGSDGASGFNIGAFNVPGVNSPPGSYTLSAIENIVGGPGDETLVGSDMPNVLSGGAGNDTLDSNAGLERDWAGQAFRLYETALGRGPDVGGFDYWIGQFRDGMNLGTAAGGFTGSPEFQSTYGSMDDTQFVTLLYNNALHRAPDPGGLAYWLNQLTTGMSRSDVVLGFSESAEEKGDQQAGLQDFIHFQDQAQSNVLDGGSGTDTASYTAAQGGVTVSLAVSGPQETFGAGIDTLSNIENLTGSSSDDRLTGDANPNVLSGGPGNDILDSSGGLEHDWAGQAYRLYETTLNRDPDPGGFDYWVSQLRSGMTLDDAANGFTGSPEFQNTYGSLDDTQFVTLLYGNALHRAPDPGGLSYWLNLLNTGTSRSDVVLGFSNSPEQQGDQQAGVQDFIHFVDPAQGNILDGGDGSDTASYALAQGGVTVSLAVSGPQETFGAGVDTLVNIENLTGSTHADTLSGDINPNTLTGGGGGDTMKGHAGEALNPTDPNTYVYNATTDFDSRPWQFRHDH